MAALRQLVQNFNVLSLQASRSVTSRILTEIPRAQSSANVISSAVSRCSLHTTAVCERVLDSRLQTKSKYPSSKTGLWKPIKKISELYDYTTKPVPFPKTGGRGPNGRIWNHRRSGGHKRNFRMIDWVRGGPDDGKLLVERVERICYDPNRSGRIALVASGERKRYIIATQNMKAGDLIKSSRQVTSTAVRGKEGDAYPLGSLPVGTLVNCVEIYPNEGGLMARSAGVTAQLVRKQDSMCVVRLPSKREISVSSQCVATIGRISNVDHNKRIIGKAGRNRWLGIKPRSGRWHRKDGRFGRKIKPIKPMITYDRPRELQSKNQIYSQS